MSDKTFTVFVERPQGIFGHDQDGRVWYSSSVSGGTETCLLCGKHITRSMRYVDYEKGDLMIYCPEHISFACRLIPISPDINLYTDGYRNSWASWNKHSDEEYDGPLCHFCRKPIEKGWVCGNNGDEVYICLDHDVKIVDQKKEEM